MSTSHRRGQSVARNLAGLKGPLHIGLLHYSVLSRVKTTCLYFSAWATVVYVLDHHGLMPMVSNGASASLVGVLSMVVGLLVSFRSSSSVERCVHSALAMHLHSRFSDTNHTHTQVVRRSTNVGISHCNFSDDASSTGILSALSPFDEQRAPNTGYERALRSHRRFQLGHYVPIEGRAWRGSSGTQGASAPFFAHCIL